jgi:hypothetical protein
MSSWSSVVALSGFEYDGAEEAVKAVPPSPHRAFRSFWASGTGWGEFSYAPIGGGRFTLRVLAGKLRCRTVLITNIGKGAKLRVGDKEYAHSVAASGDLTLFTPEQTIVIAEDEELRIEAGA